MTKEVMQSSPTENQEPLNWKTRCLKGAVKGLWHGVGSTIGLFLFVGFHRYAMPPIEDMLPHDWQTQYLHGHMTYARLFSLTLFVALILIAGTVYVVWFLKRKRLMEMDIAPK
ncbi:hypothetical protein OAU50_04660 [Planctomycetota bacterium]|nr:hypothetical protein [Planctomycetota bacterium]